MHPGIHAAENGEKIAYAMATSGESVTYAELEACSNQGAHLFRSLGLVPGDGIAILLPNHSEYLKITWAAQRSGLYYTPISTFFQLEEIHYILENSDAKVLVTNRELYERVRRDLPAGLSVFSVDADGIAAGHSLLHWQTESAAFPETPIADECEGAEMIYSSGTTGRPKGVRFPLSGLPLGSVSALFKTRVQLHEVDTHTRYLSTAPLYHSAPLRYNMMVTRLGGSCRILEKFDPIKALHWIQAESITHSQWVPTMFIRLLKLPKAQRLQYDVSSLKYVIHAAAPCPIKVKQQMINWLGPILYEYYSGTEANGSTAITSQEWLTHQGSVGRAIHGELRILDEAGAQLPPLQEGLVFFANGSDFSYHKDPVKTAAAKTEAGWSTLGDIGYVDDEGYLYLKDRKNFMIISGGVNIYPQETENVLVDHPLVADVAVFGVPNDEFGEEVKAVVELTDHQQASSKLEAELINFCRSHISPIKCPRSIDFEERLPRHPTGKLYKQQLRARYWPVQVPQPAKENR